MQTPSIVLNDAHPVTRRLALESLVAARRGPQGSASGWDGRKINLHAHTIFSYSGYGYSPIYLAWLASSEGWYALGTVDFDVLDSVDETLEACALCGVRGAAGFETRVYLPDRPQEVFNSPGEPGVMYFVGMGLTSSTPAASAAPVLAGLRTRAEARNRDMVSRVNGYLQPVVLDYEIDVLPLTPNGNATERHMLLAYDAAARRLFPDRRDLLRFWSDKLGLSTEAVDAFIGDTPFPHDAIRSRLMKQGGPGYIAPGPDSFPPLETVIAATKACGGLPCYAFVDGTSSGEQNMAALLEDLIERGIVALVVIPDRNWNVPDETRSQDLVRRLHATLDVASELHLPVFIGTEMNKPGQLLVDDLSVPALTGHAGQFREGADMLYAHTALARGHGLGFQSQWAQAELPSRRERAGLYTALGRLLRPHDDSVDRAARILLSDGPQAALKALQR
ncbi:MAG: hypothetical protein ACYCYF_05845 [Anaerolineae bacterium]